MSRTWFYVTSILASLFMIAISTADAADPLVFVSSFAPGDEGGVHAFAFDASTGKLQPLKTTLGVPNAFFLAISPNQKYLYSIHAPTFGGKEPESVAAYEITRATGALKFLNKSTTLGTASCYLEALPAGKLLLCANYSSGSFTALTLRPDGSIGSGISQFESKGSSVNPDRQKEPHPHCFVPSPDGRFAFGADLGIDKIVGFEANEYGTMVRKASATPTPAGAGPRHLTFHPNGKWMYVINELANSVTHFDYDAAKGQLTPRATLPTLPADFKGTSHCADLKITPNGRFLYGTNRGHDSLACYSIGDDGVLKLIEIVPSRGKGPQNLLIAGEGRWLLCANMPGDNVSIFAIDATTGKITPHGETIAVKGASCIRLVP